jgi:hypothetical protein
MPTVSVRRRVRPIRFAFLVNHRDPTELRKAVEVNTVLWAGMFNAIVPVFKRTPANWRTTWTATEIVRGYLDAFEPDFVITGAGVDATTYGVPPTSTGRLDTMLTRDGLGKRGTDVMDVYQWRYQRDFRFVQREPIRLHLPVASSTRLSLFCSTVFGGFPGPPLEHFSRGFRDLGGKEVPLLAESYGETLRKSTCPLRLGMSGLDDPGFSGPRRAFFLLNPRSVSDLIDFWNLRALGWRIVAVPIAWIPDVAPRVAKTIQAEHRPNPHFNPHFHRARVLSGRSVPASVVTEFLSAVGAGTDTTLVQSLLPRLWDDSVRDADDAVRVELSAGKDELTAEAREDRVSFKTIGPVFARRHWGHEVRVANVIELRSYDLPNLANIVPKDFADLDGLLRSYGRADMIRNTSEGVTLLADSEEQSVTWRLPQGVRQDRGPANRTGRRSRLGSARRQRGLGTTPWEGGGECIPGHSSPRLGGVTQASSAEPR